ncbi:sterol desaturase family protein [Limnohabitans sp.]|jgi:sterol desaturase/sphingolipid hydroxylase (fatty acid hydroxylase superfamily)|uniref:sterol desaturase family protein n=1 Tax=Limnohabitans sp. TaxID=1907725 RepID=UPI0025C19906|nr:sterol desaturase family protein [Limnohabitans sp.]
MDFLIDLFDRGQQMLFEAVVQPLAFAAGQGQLLEKAYEGTGWVVVGLLQLMVMWGVIGPMQRRWPAEPLRDRQAVRVDVIYTLIHRLGLFKLGMFFTLDYAFEQGLGVLRTWGMPTLHLDGLWPGVTDLALVSFVLYLVVFDFVHYWIHRAQHQSNAWWALHALHHSQRQMTMWSDNRNHLLDDMLTSLILSAVAVLIGVGPGQFVALVAISQLSENFQHANVRLWFGRVGERLWVSPRFHRRHHSVGIGHEFDVQGRKVLGGCNFGVLLPWWDMLFGTADFQLRYDPTGVRDQVEQGRDYGRGFWAQQRLGLLRLLGRA